MNITNISQGIPIVQHYLAQLRDVEKQQDVELFRRIVYKLGIILAVESSKVLDYQSKIINTPFSETSIDCLTDHPIIYSIVRAGLKLQEGVASIFEGSLCGFCSCRKDSRGIRHAELFTSCDTTNKTVYICEPITTSGSSIIEAVKAIEKNGMPSKLIILNIITTPLAISNIQEAINEDTYIFTCAIDEFTKGVKGTKPGLGDAGDLLYGKS